MALAVGSDPLTHVVADRYDGATLGLGAPGEKPECLALLAVDRCGVPLNVLVNGHCQVPGVVLGMLEVGLDAERVRTAEAEAAVGSAAVAKPHDELVALYCNIVDENCLATEPGLGILSESREKPALVFASFHDRTVAPLRRRHSSRPAV